MTDEEIRTKIREKLKKGILPRNLIGLPTDPCQGAKSQSAFSTEPPFWYPCSACGEGKADFTVRPQHGEEFRFHEKCYQIYTDEVRKPPISN